MINPEFKAVFNVFTKQLAVLYGSCISIYQFNEFDEWTKISFNGDENSNQYLHIHLDYDETLQLLFYPRFDNDPEESLNEDHGTYFNSSDMDDVPSHLRIVFSDEHYDNEFENFLGRHDICQVCEGL